MTTSTHRPTTRLRTVLHRWPSLLGLVAAAAALGTGVSAEPDAPATAVAVAALCYLGAAALDRRWVAWAGILGGSLVVVAGRLVGLPWWGALGIVALALVVVGLLIGVPRRPLTAQTMAVAGFGGLAVVAVFLAPQVGLVLAGTVLASHAIWDVIHYRRDEVVSRSLAEFCILLDVPLGVGCIVLALVG